MRLCHVHIPKSAGSALNRHALFYNAPRDRICTLYDLYIREKRLEFEARSVDELRQAYDIFAGHVPYGYVDQLGKDVIYLSIFREPDARFLSMINFVLAYPQHGYWRASGQRFGSLEGNQIIESIPGMEQFAQRQRNVMVRLAAGQSLWTKPTISDDELVGCALGNLAMPNYLWGFQERFDEYLRELKSRLGLRYEAEPFLEEGERDQFRSRAGATKYVTKNFSNDRKISLTELSPKARQVMAALNEIDRIFYARLQELAGGLNAA